MELPGALPVANIRSSLHIKGPAPSIQNTMDTSNQKYQDKIYGGLKHGGVQNERLRDPAHEILIHGLEKFSTVTKFSLENTVYIFGENHLLSSIDSPEENYLHTDNGKNGNGQAIKPEKRNGKLSRNSTSCFSGCFIGHYIISWNITQCVTILMSLFHYFINPRGNQLLKYFVLSM